MRTLGQQQCDPDYVWHPTRAECWPCPPVDRQQCEACVKQGRDWVYPTIFGGEGECESRHKYLLWGLLIAGAAGAALYYYHR